MGNGTLGAILVATIKFLHHTIFGAKPRCIRPTFFGVDSNRKGIVTVQTSAPLWDISHHIWCR